MNKFFTLVMVASLCSCLNRSEPSGIMVPVPEMDSTATTGNRVIENLETYTDSLNIGRPGMNKVMINRYRYPECDSVEITLFVRRGEQWNRQQKLSLPVTSISGLDPEYLDYTNDGIRDLTIVSATAARGANVVRTLLIYEKNKEGFVVIRNSEQFPNLRYNDELNCIDAFLVYGGSSTCFLTISGDSLRKFAEVQAFDGLTVTEYDKHGKEKVILYDSTFTESYVRFSRYKPVKRAEDY